MQPEELRSYRKQNKLTQAALASRLDVKTRTVVAWENGQNPIPKWVSDRLKNESLRLNPKMDYETFQAAQSAAAAKGQSLEQWIADLIKNAVGLFMLAGILYALVES